MTAPSIEVPPRRIARLIHDRHGNITVTVRGIDPACVSRVTVVRGGRAEALRVARREAGDNCAIFEGIARGKVDHRRDQ